MAEIPLLNQVREMILEGKLEPGQRVTEVGLAERLGISRTPVRNILPALAAEGFLQRVGGRGFAVMAFSDAESLEALELRATLEGHAARMVAAKPPSPELLDLLQGCLGEGDDIFAKGYLVEGDRERYGAMNAAFHEAIVRAAGSQLLSALIERTNHVPFVSPSIMVFDRVNTKDVFNLLFHAHGHHHAIVDALRQRDGARADALFREHANGQRMSMFERRLRG